MKRILIAMVAAALAAAQSGGEAERLFSAAKNTETVDGNLQAAIKQYNAIVSKYGKSDRPVAAMALVRTAECYQRLGDAQAEKIYQRVLNDYADQKDAVAEARERLNGGTQAGVAVSRLVAKGRKITPSAAVSADGRYLAHTGHDTGELMLFDISGQTERRITDIHQTDNPNMDAEQPTFSHDGKQVAYECSDDKAGSNQLCVSSLAGPPNSRRLYGGAGFDDVRPLDWSPDGQSIAVWVVKPKVSESQLGVVSVRDGSWKPWIALPQWALDRAYFSPDGKYLAYDLRVSLDQPKGGLFMLAAGGTFAPDGLTLPDHCHLMGWSPDGRRLLITGDLNGATSLWALPMAAGKPQGARQLLKASLGGERPIGITASGTLYFWGEHSFRQLLRIDSLDVGNGRILSTVNELLPEFHHNFAMPMWSPDGRYLMYVSSDSNDISDTVAIRSADGRQMVREFPLQLHWGAALRWTPDGQSFLSAGADDQKRAGIYRIDATTGNLTLLVPGERLNWPASSPDGKSLYFMRAAEDRKPAAVVRRDLASGDEREIIRGDSIGPPSLSPDGRYIAVHGADPASKENLIRLVSTDGGESRDLRLPSTGTDKAPEVLGAIWLPDSLSFLTRRRIEGHPLDEVWRVPVDGDPPRKTEITFARNVPIYLNISPDGRQIAYGIANGYGNDWEVWALETFLPPSSALPAVGGKR